MEQTTNDFSKLVSSYVVYVTWLSPVYCCGRRVSIKRHRISRLMVFLSTSRTLVVFASVSSRVCRNCNVLLHHLTQWRPLCFTAVVSVDTPFLPWSFVAPGFANNEVGGGSIFLCEQRNAGQRKIVHTSILSFFLPFVNVTNKDICIYD